MHTTLSKFPCEGYPVSQLVVAIALDIDTRYFLIESSTSFSNALTNLLVVVDGFTGCILFEWLTLPF